MSSPISHQRNRDLGSKCAARGRRRRAGIRAITFGLGGELTANRSQQTHATNVTTTLRSADETFTAGSAHLSLNFGTGHGWSDPSGGIGQSQWSMVPAGQEPLGAHIDRLKTVNYGGGARWFAKRHVGFSLDVRFYAIAPSAGEFGYPGTPRATLLAIAAGMSLK